MVACKQSEKEATNPAPQTPQQYLNRIMDMENSLAEPMLKTEAEIKVRSEKLDYEGATTSAKAMEDTIQLKVNEWNALKAVGNGGEDFKIMGTRYLEFLKSIYTGYKKIGSAADDDARAVEFQKLSDILKAQPQVQANLQQAVATYSADNNLH